MPLRALSSVVLSWVWSWQCGLFSAVGLWFVGVFAQAQQSGFDGPIQITALGLLAIALRGLLKTNERLFKANNALSACFQGTLDRICDRWHEHEGVIREEFDALRTAVQETRLHCVERLARHEDAGTNGKE